MSELRAGLALLCCCLCLGSPVRACETDQLLDLVVQRLALMPQVARAKQQLDKPVEDLQREAVVLQQSAVQALQLGLPKAELEAFMRTQINLAKAIQYREPAAVDESIDGAELFALLRPQLSRLGSEQLRLLACLRNREATLNGPDYLLLADLGAGELLLAEERRRLFQSIQAVLTAP